MTIAVDQRSIPATRQPEAHARITGALERLRDLQVELAKDFALVDRSNHFVHEGCASVVEYGVRLGYSRGEVRTLTHLGKTFAAEPEAEARFRAGTLTLDAGAAIGRIYARPILLRPGDRWLRYAESDPLRTLRRRIKERVEAQAQAYAHAHLGLEEITLLVTARTKDRFDRAREVASQQADEHVTEGQTFTRLVDFYLAKNDPLLKPGRARRVGPTHENPQSRYVPADVRRQIERRSGGVCEVPMCEHRLGLELAHRTPHASGSGREASDLGQLCHRHHVLYDAGEIPWPLPREPGGPPGAAAADPPRKPPRDAPRDAPRQSNGMRRPDPDPPDRVAESREALVASRCRRAGEDRGRTAIARVSARGSAQGRAPGSAEALRARRPRQARRARRARCARRRHSRGASATASAFTSSASSAAVSAALPPYRTSTRASIARTARAASPASTRASARASTRAGPTTPPGPRPRWARRKSTYAR